MIYIIFSLAISLMIIMIIKAKFGLESHKFNSRKFILVTFLSVIVITMKLFRIIGDESFTNIIISLYGFYCGSNVVTKFTRRED